MNGYNLLEGTVWDILNVIVPAEDDWNIRIHIIQELRSIVESVESLRGATVEPFGSFASDLFTKWGDLDVSIEVQNGSYLICPGKKHKLSLLGDVLRALRRSGGFHRLQFISNARVPILKFESSHNISCDVSINNLCGQMKSKILYWINQIDGRFRSLVLLVKEWAKRHRINDSKSGTLNSYSLSLLVIFHFQTVVPPILPPLSEIYPGNMIDDLTGIRTVAEKHIEDTCCVTINRIKSQGSRIINRSPLSELFVSFLTMFSDVLSRASTQGVSPHSGRFEDLDTNMRWLPKTYALFVEDPFEQPANTARAVSSKQLVKIRAAVHETRAVLVSGNQHKDHLLSVLVGQHVARLLWRPLPAPTPLFSHPAWRAPTPLLSQALPPRRNGFPEKKYQNNKSTDKKQRYNGAMNEPVQASTSQNQQRVWKAKN